MATLRRCLGVDLGSNAVKVVELAIDRKGVRVIAAGSEETGVEPATGADERKAAIAKALKSVIRKNKMSSRHAIFALPGQKVFVRRFRLPETTPERMEKIVAFEARQQIPFPIDKTDLQWQFFPLPGEGEVEVLLVAVRHDEVREYMTLANRTGLKSMCVSVSSFALFNAQTFFSRPAAEIDKRLAELTSPRGGKSPGGLAALKKLSKKKKGAEETAADQQETQGGFEFEEVRGYVNIGAGAMDLIIAPQGKNPAPKFSRSVPTAGNEVTRSIMQACDIASFPDAERIKKFQTKLASFDFDTDDDPNLNQTACAAATQSVDRLVAELRRSLDFFITQPDGMAVDALAISGGQALMPGLAKYIEEKLTIPVTLTESAPDGLPFKWPDGTKATEYMVALGLALQGVGLSTVGVDFLPEDRKILRDFPYKTVGVMGALLAGAIVMTFGAGDTFAVKYANAATSARDLANSNKPRISAMQMIQDRQNKVAGDFDKFREGVGQRNYWMDFLALVSEQKPADVLVLDVFGNHDGFVRIVGACESQRSAADFNSNLKTNLKELDTEPELKDIRQAQGAQLGMPDKPTVFRFVIELKTGDKLNRLEVTPTPDPNKNQGQPMRPGMPGGGGRFSRPTGVGAGILE